MGASQWLPTKLDELGYVGCGTSRHRPRNAAGLFAALGWQTVSVLEETFGPSPPTSLPEGEGRIWLGRETKGELVLTDRLRAAIIRLNPGLPAETIQTAMDELARDRSATSLETANRELCTSNLPRDDGHRRRTLEQQIMHDASLLSHAPWGSVV